MSEFRCFFRTDALSGYKSFKRSILPITEGKNFLRPRSTTECGCDLFAQHVGGGASHKNLHFFLIDQTSQKFFPTIFHVDLIEEKNKIIIFYILWIHVEIGVENKLKIR